MDDLTREVAWRVHGLQEAWIARVDVKASIVLAFEGGFFIAAATTGLWEQTWAAGGMGLLIVSICFAAGVVLPSTGSVRKARAHHGHNFIYFGHLRHWKPEELSARLSGVSRQEELDMVARQIVTVSRISWLKHRLLQASVITALIGVISIAVAGLAQIN